MKRKVFEVVSCGRDEYPGDGLRLSADGDKNIDKGFLRVLGLEVQEGDEVEVTARVVSRMELRRVPVEDEKPAKYVCGICRMADSHEPDCSNAIF